MALQNNSNQDKHIMISYNWKDSKELADKINDRLCDAGYNVWMDKGQMKGDIYEKMAQGVRNSHVLLMFMSSNYEKSQHCKREASLAADMDITVIPIRVQHGYEPGDRLRLLTAGQYYHDFSKGSFIDNYNELHDAIKAMDGIEVTRKAKTSIPAQIVKVPENFELLQFSQLSIPSTSNKRQRFQQLSIPKALPQPGNVPRIHSIGGRLTMQKVVDVINVSEAHSRVFPDLPVKKLAHCCTVLNDKEVYAIGGSTDGKDASATKQVCLLDLKKKALKWKEVAPMKVPRCALAAAVTVNGKIYVVGGANEKEDQLSSGEYYTPASNKWADISPMKQPRCRLAVVACKEYVYAMGGFGNDEFLSSVERFHPRNNLWKKVPSMKVPRRWLAAVTLNDSHIYAIGGRSGVDEATTTQKSVERFNVTTNKWADVGEMNVGRACHAACVLQGKIYVSGGLDKDGFVVKSVECYDPSTDKWTIVGETQDGLFHHALVPV
ncbi:uncharacterized protein LOC143451252 isoform X1 [Clavelina lepadiformis]|uniref:uncharacterized protein LOC143451252 isoform X1 n=2 Tax=Clavelina lepadiformis TaxID=159417 RepID=UPI0040431A63